MSEGKVELEELAAEGQRAINVREATCLYCGTTGKIRVEWRPELRARPLGSHSLSGNQLKVSAMEVTWPWAVCDGCGHESRGRDRW